MQWMPNAGITIEGCSLSSSSKAWKGTRGLQPLALPGAEGNFSLTVQSGLVRLGLCTSRAEIDNLGTDLLGFGFGGTGKKSHAGTFEDYGEPFGVGDRLECVLRRDVRGGVALSYSKNGRDLGLAFELEASQLPQLSELPLFPAICGRAFVVNVDGDADAAADAAAPWRTCEELRTTLRYYALRSRGAAKSPVQKAAGAARQEDAHTALQRFFATSDGPEEKTSAVAAWLQGRAEREGRVDFRNSKEVRRVQRTHALPSGVTLTIIDSQPASKAGADRSYARNVALWESLPRGHAEVRQGEVLVCELSGLRKFGSAEEKFGPLAREAQGARRCALQALPSSMSAMSDPGQLVMVFLTKENGEMCKVSFFQLGGDPYLALGSKNVTLVINVANKKKALADLAAYEEERYQFAVEMAEVFLDQLFDELSENQRKQLISFVTEKGATLCGESISPMHQHIQSYRDGHGKIQAHIRFFSVTSPAASCSGLTLLDPVEAAQHFRAWGLHAVEAIDEALVKDQAEVDKMEKKHLLLPNREGAVVYVVLRKANSTRTALVYKWKNAWYVTVRALREKFCKRASEARIRSRIRLLHVHHPEEQQLVEDFMSFYRFVLLLLSEKAILEHLGSLWVALKAAHDAFQAGSDRWFEDLPTSLTSQMHPRWLELFPCLYATLKAQCPLEHWVELLRKHRALLEMPKQVDDIWPEQAVQGLTKGCRPMEALPEPMAEPGEALTLLAVLVRGLQGSGKSTLCRALAHLTQGEWINQDEVAAGARRGSSAKELFLKAIQAAAAKPHVRYIFIDKIHILKQHRDDVVSAVTQGFQGREGRVALVLLNLCHPDDDEGDYQQAAERCTARISQRGLGHLSLVPQATDAAAVVRAAGEDAEVLTDEEKCSFDLCADLDLRLPRLMLLAEAMKTLQQGNFLETFSEELMEEAVQVAQNHELKLSARWKTLYWMVALDWSFLWHDSARELWEMLAEAIDMCPDLAPINDPHVTMLWLGASSDPELEAPFAPLEGVEVEVTLQAVCYDATLGLVALRASLEEPFASLCQNQHPHITVAKGPGVAAKQSNDLLERASMGDSSVETRSLTPLRVKGRVQRQLASESLAAAAASSTQLPEGHPVCELGLVATREATDVWMTHESHIRVKKISRILDSLLCPVSQPLLHCKGWPPALRGKKWFTFHERPLSAESRQALEALQRSGSCSTLHAGVAYFQLEGLETLDLQQLSERLQQSLAEPRLAEALQGALCALDAEPTAAESPSFYVQCKSAGSKEQTIALRQALARAVAAAVGWIPEIKKPDHTLSAQVKDDWILLGLVIQPTEQVKPKTKVSVQAAPPGPATTPAQAPTAPAAPQMDSGLLQIDGASLEGGGQLLRNSVAYAVTLQRGVCIKNVRGGRSTQGLRPGHLAALDALASISKARFEGGVVGSAHVTFHPLSPVQCTEEGPLEVDAGTGGSTMLMLQALLPCMLADSKNREVEVIFKGGTNVCSPPGKGHFEINAPQVDYVQLVLFPMLRQLFGVRVQMEVLQRGFLQGGGQVRVTLPAGNPWPLPAIEVTEVGEIRKVSGTAYRSANVPSNVLQRMLEGQLKKQPAGAAVLLQHRLPDVSPEWNCQDCPSANGADACGLIVAFETSQGCRFGGDSMGRKGTMAEVVGEEAVRHAWAAFERGGCCDEHLEDQLVVYMALARGTSRLRLGLQPSLHFQTAIWLAEGFGASVRIVDDDQGRVLEIRGIGST